MLKVRSLQLDGNSQQRSFSTISKRFEESSIGSSSKKLVHDASFYLQHRGRKPHPKRGTMLWSAVRKSIPAFVGRATRHLFRRARAPPLMIDPESNPKRMWDVLLMLCVLYTTVVVPYRVCFRQDAVGLTFSLEAGMDGLFFADICANFITGVHLPSGEVSYNMKFIAGSYLRGWFVVDFFSTLPYESLARAFGYSDNAPAALMSTKLLRGLKVLRLFKLVRIRKISKAFTNLEDAVNTNQSLLSLIKLGLTMLFAAHIAACIWFAVGSIDDNTSWVISYINSTADPQVAASHDDPQLLYLASMYWAIVTMTTIGYGDIVAQNIVERIVNIGIMAIGVSFFGYVIGTISSLVANLDVAAALYEERMTTIKEYIISRQIPSPMSKRIREHFEYYYQNRSVFKERKILYRLPSAMRNEMIHHLHEKLVSGIKYLQECHESLVSDLVIDMQPFACAREDFVYVQHEIAAHVFFLLKGKIYLTKAYPNTKNEQRLATFSVGEHFGELEVYDHDHGNGVRICSAVAKSYCELTFLSRGAINKMSRQWPEVAKHFKDAATAASKKMRRRADHDRDDALDSAQALFEDEELQSKMMRSTALAKKNMRQSMKPPRAANRITPYEDSEHSEFDSSQSSVSHSPLPSNNAYRQSLPHIEDEEHSEVVQMARPPKLNLQNLTTVNSIENDSTITSDDLIQSGSHGKVALKALSSEPPNTPKVTANAHFRLRGMDYEDLDGRDKRIVRNNSSGNMRAIVMPNIKTNRIGRDSPNIDALEEVDGVDDENGSENADSEGGTKQPHIMTSRDRHEKSLRAMIEHQTTTDDHSLDAILAKIRDSPIAKPRHNVLSELVLLKGTYLWHPHGSFLMGWQFVVGILILYSIVVVPFRLGFQVDAQDGFLYLELFIDGLFMVDIVFNFRTAFYNDEKILIYDKRAIMWRYLKGWFVLDVLSTIPFDEIAGWIAMATAGSSNVSFVPTKLLRLARIARLLKLVRLIKLSRIFGRIREIVQWSPSTERFMRLLLLMGLFCHWNACLFHAAMLQSENSGTPNWCTEVFYPNYSPIWNCTDIVPLDERYVASMYWAFTTLTTVGYGDVKPSIYSPYETGLVIFLIVVHSTLFGYILTSVIALIRNLNPSEREYKILMTEMKDYLRDVAVGTRIRMNIKTHYQHFYTVTSLFPEKKIFDKMSPSLRFDTARLVAAETLFAIPLITVMEDSFKGFVSYALFLLKPMCITRTEKVCRSGGPGIEMFFLVEGECDLVNSHTGQGRVIGESAVFEQYSLIAPSDEIYRTMASVTAISPKCILYSLSNQDFRTLEHVSPAVSSYFLSQLAAVLIEDEFFTLTKKQRENVEAALSKAQTFHAMADHKLTVKEPRLSFITGMALAKKANARRGSEWSPESLPRQLSRMAEEIKRRESVEMTNSTEFHQPPCNPNEIPHHATSIGIGIDPRVNQTVVTMASLAASSLNGVKIYNLASGKTLPQWIQEKTKKALSKDEDYRRRVELLQDFHFASGSQRVKMSPDGNYVVATGMYPPTVKVYDVRDLSMKFERRLDAEVVQFDVLSPDYGKLVFLQSDRTITFHAPYGVHYGLRIPKFGRDMVYHRENCELYVAASSPEVYRVNLDQGRFYAPLEIAATAANVVRLNPIHQLLGVGCDNGTVECWDTRSQQRVGLLDTITKPDSDVQVSALEFDDDGLTFAVGTSNGECLLYDLRSSRPLLHKTHQYGLPIIDLKFHDYAKKVLSSDAKAIKIWDKHTGDVFTSVETPAEIRDVCVVDGTQGKSGVLMVAGEQERVMAYYIPELGIAPKWCSFLDSLTEELEEEAQTTVYDDYKFVTRKEIMSFGLEHLIGTPLLKAYMHGFFMDARLYAKVKAIAEPFAYDKYRKERIQAKLEEKHANRITIQRRLPKINRATAERLLRTDQKKKQKTGDADDQDDTAEPSADLLSNPLGDERFASMFTSKDFEVDEESETYKMLHPNAANSKNQKRKQEDMDSDAGTDDDDDDDGNDGEDRFARVSDDEESEVEGRPSDESSDEEDAMPARSTPAAKADAAKRKPKFYEIATGERVDDLMEFGSKQDRVQQKQKKMLAKLPLAERLKLEKQKEQEKSKYKKEEKEGGGYIREMSFIPASDKRRQQADAANGGGNDARRKKRGVGDLKLANPGRNPRFRR
ncbi:TPA: hypothetical protein N0F65_008318 [Lagenidium giganteum]|uniref:Cyclic nucleotide-binding domain-containing protein n=1 Tax=Lagenidium giganteum TaxID=4803 RepID=A0AAV2YQC4_9STRA|nr:TPA: hypothetical protein N0F65_008318 [Lagenidium giganteum]